jgi:hypothetical protein
MLVKKEMIRNNQGRIIGWIETDHLQNKVVRDFTGRIKGRYKKVSNTTLDSRGKIVGYGDSTSSLLFNK